MVIIIKGAGDIASGIATRLFRCGYQIIMTETARPTTVRRTVSFSPAVYTKATTVEGITACLARNTTEAFTLSQNGKIAVLVDENALCVKEICPNAVIDAILAKRNTGTSINDAPIVIGVGPGFTANSDCHAVIETKRGHTLGKCIYSGSAIQNTGIPGDIGGFTSERLIKACCNGTFTPLVDIGSAVKAGEIIATINGEKITANISGIIRGMLPNGSIVTKGMKSGDIDPRNIAEYCYTVSDKALAVAGGVLEALLHFEKAEN